MAEYDDEEDGSFFQRHRALVIVGVIVLLAGAGFAAKAILGGSSSAPARAESFQMVMLPPPPPPPPPKPTPPPPDQPPPEKVPDQKLEDQSVVEKKMEAPKEEKPPDAPPALGTSLKASADGMAGLAQGNGDGMIGGSGKGGGGGSRFGFYYGQMKSRVHDALQNNPRTRKASATFTVNLWPDDTGRITRVTLSSGTGDAALDAAIQNEVLNGLQMAEPPPAGIPKPITMRIRETRPR